jgi:uncharacterized oxidoreductase
MSNYVDPAHAYVLITGGSNGIGRCLATRFLAAGSRVLVTGRSPEKLEEAARELPGLLTFVNDIGKAAEREALAGHVQSIMPGLNVLINNAGIQRRVPLATDEAPWAERQGEIDTLLSGPVHLNHLLAPLMLAHGQPGVLVNVSSGGGFIPQVFAPVYSACKAAIHSYSVTLRHALRNTPVRVVELVPPAVQTGLAGPGASAHGAPLDAFCNEVFPAVLRADSDEVGFGPTNSADFRKIIESVEPLFKASAARFPVKTYGS